MKDAKDKLVKAIEVLSDKIKEDVSSIATLQYTQAALNAAHAIQVLGQVKKDEN